MSNDGQWPGEEERNHVCYLVRRLNAGLGTSLVAQMAGVDDEHLVEHWEALNACPPQPWQCGWAQPAGVGGRRRRTGTATSSRGRNAGPGNTAEIRKWAQENGYEVSERGRIPAAVREAYAAAH